MMNSGANEDRKRKASSELEHWNGTGPIDRQPPQQPDPNAAAKEKLTSSIQEMNDLFDYVKQDTRGLSDAERRKLAEKVGVNYPGDANPKTDRAVGPDDRDEIFDCIHAVRDGVTSLVAAAKEAVVGIPGDEDEQDANKVKDGEGEVRDEEEKGITTTVQEKVHDMGIAAKEKVEEMATAAKDYGIAAKDKVVEMGTIAKEKVEEMATAAKDYGIAAKDKVVEKVHDMATAAQESGVAAKEKASEMATSTSDTIATKYGEVREKVADTKEATVHKSNEVKEKMKEAYSERKAELEQSASHAKDTAGQIFAAAKDAATNFGNTTKDILSDPKPTPEDKATEQEIIDTVNGAVFGSSKQKEQLEQQREQELGELLEQQEKTYGGSGAPDAPFSHDLPVTNSFKAPERKWDAARQQQHTQGL